MDQATSLSKPIKKVIRLSNLTPAPEVRTRLPTAITWPLRKNEQSNASGVKQDGGICHSGPGTGDGRRIAVTYRRLNKG